MCGINGIITRKLSSGKLKEKLTAMNNRLAHRGPDGNGEFVEEHTGLGHRRLSIIDLSDAGAQPMQSADGRFVLVFNGEIYNYRELKFQLVRAEHGSSAQPYPFRTNTDTEVLLAAWSRWGEQCVSMLDGMFAFAMYDRKEKELFLVRDRLGVKPLYYFSDDDTLTFSSEIRALMESGFVKRRIKKDSLVDYLLYQTVHAPATIIEGVKMLLPGTILTYKNFTTSEKKWWDLLSYVKSNEGGDASKAKETVRNLFFRSVEKRLVSDVPFGAFLSGGIDSSAVVAAMAEVSSAPVETFNVSFDESRFSESVYAQKISQKFNTRHHEIKVSPDDFLRMLPQALTAMDHPSGDGPNTYVVSSATKNAGITMALSGIGGDELFCGYDIFKRSYKLEKQWWLNMVPRFARVGAAQLYKLKDNSVASEKIVEVLSKPIVNFQYAYPLSRQVLSDALVRGITKRQQLPMNAVYKIVRLQNIETRSLRLSKYSCAEIETYLQNVLLRDTDQMSMAVALEVREPFLDHQLVEYVLGLEDKLKYPHTPKQLLTDAMGSLLPTEIIDRPKMGFTFPWAMWMKNELKNFCEDRIISFSKRDFINGDVVKALWSRFLAGDPKITWSRLWHMIVLENWMIENKIEN